MVDDDVEVNLEAISSKYGGGLLKWKKGDEKDNDDKKDVEENVKSVEEQPQVAEEEDLEPPTVIVHYNGKNDTMAVVEVVKTYIVFFNQEEVVGEAYQVINAYINALIQYFGTQHRACPYKESIMLEGLLMSGLIICHPQK
ncbi:hypothetical protein GIB67_009667, partial [Kingdonia uniflora]